MYSDHSELDGNPAAELGTGTAVAERKLSAVQFDGRKSVSRILDSDTNILYFHDGHALYTLERLLSGHLGTGHCPHLRFARVSG